MTSMIPKSVRNRMLLRSFAIQGSWNYETLIGSGFAFTVLPALRCLYGRGADADAALKRHLELFNSHPYIATVAVGAVTRIEEDKVDPATISRFKVALRGSLGSIGDRLVWSTWRPMSALLGLALLMAGAAWWVAVSLFLVVYNVMHLMVRAVGLKVGLESGLEVGKRLKSLPLQPIIDRTSQVACALVGMNVVLVAAPAVADPRGLVAVVAAVLSGLFLGFRARGAMTALIVTVVAIALILGMVGYGA